MPILDARPEQRITQDLDVVVPGDVVCDPAAFDGSGYELAGPERVEEAVVAPPDADEADTASTEPAVSPEAEAPDQTAARRAARRVVAKVASEADDPTPKVEPVKAEPPAAQTAAKADTPDRHEANKPAAEDKPDGATGGNSSTAADPERTAEPAPLHVTEHREADEADTAGSGPTDGPGDHDTGGGGGFGSGDNGDHDKDGTDGEGGGGELQSTTAGAIDRRSAVTRELFATLSRERTLARELEGLDEPTVVEAASVGDRAAQELLEVRLRKKALTQEVEGLNERLAQDMTAALDRERRHFDAEVRPERRAIVAATLARVEGIRPGMLDSTASFPVVRWNFRLPEPEEVEDGPLRWHHFKVYAKARAWPLGIRQADHWLLHEKIHGRADGRICPPRLLGVPAEGRGHQRYLPSAALQAAMENAKYRYIAAGMDNIDELEVRASTTESPTDAGLMDHTVVTVRLDEHDAAAYPHYMLDETENASDYLARLFARRSQYPTMQTMQSFGDMLAWFTDRRTQEYLELADLNEQLTQAVPLPYTPKRT